MNEPEINLPTTPRSFDDLDTIESLRRQVNLLLGTLIVLSFTLTIYLGLQARRASIDYSVTKPRLVEADHLFQQDNASVQAAFNKLTEFARTHPDFQTQIFSKYKLNEPPVAKKK